MPFDNPFDESPSMRKPFDDNPFDAKFFDEKFKRVFPREAGDREAHRWDRHSPSRVPVSLFR